MTKTLQELVFDKMISGYEAKIAELEGKVRVLTSDKTMWKDRYEMEKAVCDGLRREVNAAERPIRELYEAANDVARYGARGKVGYAGLRAAVAAAKDHVCFIPF